MFQDNYFKSRFSFDPKRERLWKVIAGFLQKYVGEEASILDMGAGYCDFINNIRAKERHALDTTDIGNYASKDVTVHRQSCIDMKNLPSFDVIFVSNLFEHLSKEDFERTLSEIKSHLKKRGKLILIQPNFRYSYKVYFDDYTHQLVFTDISICDILRNHGFVISKVMPRFIPFSLKSRLPRSPLLLKIYLYSPFKFLAGQMLIIAEIYN